MRLGRCRGRGGSALEVGRGVGVGSVELRAQHRDQRGIEVGELLVARETIQIDDRQTATRRLEEIIESYHLDAKLATNEIREGF